MKNPCEEKAMSSLIERYQSDLLGILSCYDRIVITGTLPEICYAQGMTNYLKGQQIRIFDYPKVFADPLRHKIRENAQTLADRQGVNIEFVKSSNLRKEDLVAKVLTERGDHPGLVHILSAMEPCSAYEPWHDKQTHQTYLRSTPGKCLHYYFYFIDAELGLCYLRVPTWCPFRLQFYCNGHSWLARQLAAAGIDFAMADNAFIRIDNFAKAQQLADHLSPDHLHRILDRYAHLFCPAIDTFTQRYHWSLMQTEYSTDLVFRNEETLKPLYEQLSRQAVIAVKADTVSSFLGKKVTAQLAQEIGSRLSTRIEGTCIKHRMGSASVKIYDKFNRVLRIETTINDVTFFKHHRKVEHRDGTETRQLAPLKKSIYSLIDLREILLGCNRRYLEFLSTLDDYSDGQRALTKLTEPKIEQNGKWKGFNFFAAVDQAVLRLVINPKFNIQGLRRTDLKSALPTLSDSSLSRQLKRLRVFGLIKKVPGTYRYYLTKLGRAASAACVNAIEFTILPTLAVTA
jgi:hypothetical protein